jgi:ferritin
MLKEKVQKELNNQVNKELFSAYLYLAMAAYFESLALKGFANWMNVQSQEEMTHAMRIYTYINNKGGRVELSAIEAPKKKWKDPLNAFEDAYEHEKVITKSIDDVMTVAVEEKDYATQRMLDWFINEQVEEESNATEIIEKIKLAGLQTAGMLFLDKELSTRTFIYPVTLSATGPAPDAGA